MKANNPLPCFRKTIVLNYEEHKVTYNSLVYVLTEVHGLSEEEERILNSVLDKLASPSHPQTN